LTIVTSKNSHLRQTFHFCFEYTFNYTLCMLVLTSLLTRKTTGVHRNQHIFHKFLQTLTFLDTIPVRSSNVLF